MSIEQKIAELLAESKAAEEAILDEEELKPEDDGEEPNNKKNNAKKNPQGEKSVVESLEDYSVEELEEYMMSEDYEQLDELSKNTLSSYVQKAGKSAAKHDKLAHKADLAYARSQDTGRYGVDKEGRDSMERALHHDSIASKRKAGIATATKKMTKEEIEQIDISEDVAALTNGEDLSEEFKTKAATIFEAAVVNRVKSEVSRLEEEFDAKLEEAVAQSQEALVEKVDGYLNYIVEQWINDNEIALERGMKSEILESFVAGMKGLFEEHYIDVPEEKYDLIGDMEETIESLNSALDEQVATNVEMKKILDEQVRTEIVKELSEGLVETDKEKFVSLVEELSFEDSATFEKKLQTIRENYFTNKATTKTITESVVTDEPIALTEEKNVAPQMKRYMQALNNLK